MVADAPAPAPDPGFSNPVPKARPRISWVWATWWALVAIIIMAGYFLKPPDKPEGGMAAQQGQQAAAR